ncbi:hypothetical protein [Chryseobacterium sp.]|uniref:hypothetical protein n=1 Tax=Chryseobacterium sp. TaxID=1871047 RepID=UPI00388F0E8A
MIKKVTVLILLFGIIIGCKQEGNKAVLKTPTTDTLILADNGKVDSTISYNIDVNGKKSLKTNFVYAATDGTLVKVVFNYDPKDYKVAITNNNKTFTLDKKLAKGNETIYEKDDMKVLVKGDSLIIHQGKNIIELVKTKI